MEKANLALPEVLNFLSTKPPRQARRVLLTELIACSRVACLGGLLSTVGITNPRAERCDSVMDPSEFDHIITIGVLDIRVPNPLVTISLGVPKSTQRD